MNDVQFEELSRDDQESYLYDHYSDEDYAIEDALFDLDNGNFSLDDIETYSHFEIVETSIINGQHSQARDQCIKFGLHYDIILKETKQ